MKKLISILAVVALSGCSMNRPFLSTSITKPDGTVEKQELKLTTFALWPATTDLAKQRATLGKTLSVGTEGLREEGGGTNMVEALKALDSILGKVRP